MDNFVIVLIPYIGISICFVFILLRDPFKAYLIMLPFMILTRTIELPWVGERLAFFDILLVIWWLGVGLRYAVGYNDLKYPRAFFWPVILYYFALVAALSTLLNSVSTFAGIQEILIYIHLGLFGVATVGIVNTKKDILQTVRIIGVILAITSAIAIWEILASTFSLPRLFSSQNYYRVSGSFRQTNQLAGFLRTLLPITWAVLLFLELSSRNKFFLLLVSMSGIFVLLLTSSRTNIMVTILELVILLVVSLVLWIFTRKGRFPLIATVLSSILLVSAILIEPQVASSYLQTLFRRMLPIFQGVSGISTLQQFHLSNVGNELASRFMVNNYSIGWQAFIDHPIIGVGIGNFPYSYEILPGEGLEIHSGFLNLLAERGVVGSMFFFLFMVMILWYSVGNLRKNSDMLWLSLALLLSYVGSLVAGAYVVFFRRREFWLVVGLIVTSRYIFQEIASQNVGSIRLPTNRAQPVAQIESDLLHMTSD